MSFAFSRPKQEQVFKDFLQDLPTFKWDDSKETRDLGQGSYGYVKLGRFKSAQCREEQEVVVKVSRDVRGNEREFFKEAKLLNCVNGHQNVVSFKAISSRPFALMTEYVKFSFMPFGDETIVSSLFSLDFLSHANLQYDLKGFEHVVPVIAKDIAFGLKFLHENDVVHRDLKPANILLLLKRLFLSC
ncbi:uncharacterized protein [Montipora foliosa]|uniref:uncharacterized protein n=1 Tax=Montipora foliosa TaxID=591990 RepID=UPI0035F12A27